MKFIYNGCEGAPEKSTHYGIEFTIGVPADVTDSDAIKKLSGNKYFSQCDEIIPAHLSEDDDADRDEKGELIAARAARGVRADRRSSVERLRSLLEG